MEEQPPNNTISIIVSKILLALAGSGVLINAFYIFGQVYYQGYMSTLGFDSTFFPISPFDSYVWAYNASLVAGVEIFSLWKNAFLPMFAIVVLSVYIFICVWKRLDGNALDKIEKGSSKRPRFSFWLEGKFPKFYSKLKWFFLSENSARALKSSYFIAQFLWVSAMFVLLWILFPAIGYLYGERAADDKIADYEQNLCSTPNNDWNWCMEFDHEGEMVEGRLILKNEDLLGIYTAKGPVTVSMPESFYHLRDKANQ